MTQQPTETPKPQPTYPCRKCDGTGKDPRYGSTLGYACLFCHGTGRITKTMEQVQERRMEGRWV